MDGYWLSLTAVGALILVNALFAGSEIALISLRESQLRRLERRDGVRVRALARLMRDPNRYLASVQIGITLAGFLASATAAVSLAEPLVPLLSFLGAAASAVAIALLTLILTFVTLVLGELAPKRLAMQHAGSWALLAARPLNMLADVTRPAVWALGKATDLTVRVFGGRPEARAEPLTEEELRDLVAGHRGLDAEQRMIISAALEIRNRTVREIMVPRRDVFTLPTDAPAVRASHVLAASGHSRAPVLRAGPGRLDEAIGVVRLRDLIVQEGTAADIARPAVVFPEVMRVSEALRRFKTEREQFALVADEYGAIEGIVTLEDLLEEIVGEIYDETDHDVLAVRAAPDGSLQLPGTFPVHDLVDIGVELTDAPDADYTTVAGLVLAALGRIPDKPGDRVQLPNWTIEVLDVAHHAITAVRLRPTKPTRRA